MTIAQRLNELPITHTLIRRLHLRPVVNRALGTIPLVRTLPSGIRYRCSFLDSIALADDIFAQRIYDAGLTEGISTFADLGCNVGLFVGKLADFTGRRDLRGLAVDADREMIRETEWLVRTNGLDGVTPVLGLVGAGESGRLGEFYLNPAKIMSSRYAVDQPGYPSKGAWTKTVVPFLDLELLWRAVLGSARCDLLKIDIEGSEADFVSVENPFLRRVDRILIETHKWIIAAGEIQRRLEACGFARGITLMESETLEVATFVRADANA